VKTWEETIQKKAQREPGRVFSRRRHYGFISSWSQPSGFNVGLKADHL
jgi:hypothetical protein